MAAKKKYKCYFCLKYQLRYTATHRVCDACGLRQEKMGRGNRRKVKPEAFKTSRRRGFLRSPAIGNRRTSLAPTIEALLKVT